MKNKLLFSVVIPTYNRADLIEETLNSVFEQSYNDFEIIVVDNCSTDNTQELLAPLVSEGKINYIRHDKNYERSKSRNTGMLNAKGDFLTFLDSDDFMYKDCLKDAAEFAANNPETKVFHNLYELINDKKELVHSFTFPSLTDQYKALASGNFMSCIGGFIHKTIYTEIRFDEDRNMVGSEDYDIWFQVLAKHKLGRINKVNSGIREHPNRSVNSGVYKNLVYQRDKLIARIKGDPQLYKTFGPYLNRLKSSFLLQEAITLRQLRKRGRALVNLQKALLADPSVVFTRRYIAVFYNIIK